MGLVHYGSEPVSHSSDFLVATTGFPLRFLSLAGSWSPCSGTIALSSEVSTFLNTSILPALPYKGPLTVLCDPRAPIP